MNEVLVSKIFNYTSTPTKNVEGQFWFNPSTNVLSRFNGTVWKPITVSSDDVAVLTDGSKVSLTNYLNTQIAALAEGIEAATLETYKEKQGDNNLDTIITSLSPIDLGNPAAIGSGGNINISAGGASTAGTGGNITISAGSGNNGGGDVTINGGSGPTPGDIILQTGSASTGGNISISTGDAGVNEKAFIKLTGPTVSSNTGGSINISGGSGSVQGGNINITAGSATGEDSATGTIKLNVPDKSGIVIDKDLIALNYKGDTNVPPSSNEWKFYIGGSGGISAGGDFSNSKTSNLYLGYGDYSTNINLGGSNSNATINICSAGSSNSNIINIGTAKTTNYVNIGPSDSNSVYSTLTLNCETLSGKTFNTELTSTSDNNHIPTSKAVYDALTLKQDKLKYYSESDSSTEPSSNNAQVSILGSNDYQTTLNLGSDSSNGLQTINIGGSSNDRRINIGTKICGNYNNVTIGNALDGVLLTLNTGRGLTGSGVTKDLSTSATDAQFPTAAAVKVVTDSKQNATDNNLTTTDKTIVGAINEINSFFNVNTLLTPITDVKTITTTLENLIIDTQYANKPGTILINPAITNTGAILVGEAITDISKAFPIYTDQPVTIAFKNINDFKVAGNIAGDKFNYIVSFGYIGNTNIVSNNLKITTTNGVYEITPEGDSGSTTLKISKIS